MPEITFNVNARQGQVLLDAFAERHPDYEGPATDIQKAKQAIREVMGDYLRNLMRRQAFVDDSGLDIS